MLLLSLLACRVEFGQPKVSQESEGPVTLWVYTSMYQSVLDELDPLLAEQLPGVQVKWFQSGSEKVAQRLEAEWAAGGSEACILMTSDPFWYQALTERERLRPYVSPRALELDRQWVTPTYTTARLSTMVLAVHRDLVPSEDRPASFAVLQDPRYAGKLSTPDPLSSGTTFTTMAFLQQAYGWEYWEALRANGTVSAGGNSSTLQRLESSERPVGVLLLENLLKAAETGSPAEPIFPEDGAIAIPGPVAITSECASPLQAQAFVDFILSEPAQQAIVGGYMHSPFPDAAPPKGAPPLGEIALRPWSPEFTAQVAGDAEAIKERYAAIVTGTGE
ncbi:MAG: extracellular solute-binding protein [Myxococcota bacterium]|nr:extracellular solute-binding protein [Myxococcota bacterium]